MLSVDSALKTIYKNDYFPVCDSLATKRNVFYFPELSLTIGATKNDQVVMGSYSLTESLCSEDNLNFGACESGMITVQLANVDDSIVGKKMVVTQVVNETYTVAMGTYTVESCELVDDTIYKKVTAIDNMRIFNVDVASWYNSIDWTTVTTVKQFRISLYTYLGISYEDVTLCNDSMPVSKTIEVNTLNGLYVLKKIMQINGCFGHFGRDAKLYHVILPLDTASNSETFVLGAELKYIKFEDYTVSAIDKVKITQEDADAEDDIGAIYGTGTNCYTISGNFLTYGWNASQMATAAQNVSANIFNRSYRPITKSECIGVPYVEVGDKDGFTVGDITYSSYILRRVICVSDMSDSFTASGDEVLSQNTSKNEEIEKLKGKSAVLKRTVEELTNTITSLESDVNDAVTTVSEMESTVQQTSSSLTAEITARETFETKVISPYVFDVGKKFGTFKFGAGSSVTSQIIKDTNAKIQLLSDQFNVSLNDNVNQLQSSIDLTTSRFATEISNLQTNTSTQIEQLENEVALRAKTSELCNEISVSTDGISITGNRFTWSDTNSSKTADGIITCIGLAASDATLSGTFTTTGTYGTTTISNGQIVNGNTSIGLSGITTNSLTLGSSTLVSTSSGSLSVNGKTVLTDSNYTLYCVTPSALNSYSLTTHIHYTDQIYVAKTTSGNLDFYGDTNAAAVTWVQANYTPLSSSDMRLKRNIKSLDNIEDFYLSLKPKSYEFKGDLDDGYTHYGLLAQEVLSNAEEHGVDVNGLVQEYDTRGYYDEGMYTGDKAYRVDYESLNAMHIYMIQKLMKRISELEEHICQA